MVKIYLNIIISKANNYYLVTDINLKNINTPMNIFECMCILVKCIPANMI